MVIKDNNINNYDKYFVSVIIPAYNEENYISATISNVKKVLEEVRIHYEIIVVNNNSTDNTELIARNLGVKVVFQKERSIAKTRNLGAENSKGNLLLFIDADTQIDNKIIQKSFEKINEDKIKAISAISSFNKYPTIASYGVWLYNIASKILKLGVGQFILIKRDAFIKLNGFDESYLAFEELDLFRRLKEIFTRKSFEVIFYPVITSGRKFEKGKKDTSKFLKLLFLSLFDKSIGKDKSQLDFWYSDNNKNQGLNYKPYLLLTIFILFLFGNILFILNSPLLNYSNIVTPIIFFLCLFLFLDSKANIKVFLLVFIITLAIEIIGSKSGIPFGKYNYSNTYGLFGVLGVPIFISFAWYILLTTSSSVFRSRIGTVIGIIVIDIILEIFATEMGIWNWEQISYNNILVAPIFNYISWGLIAFLFYPLIKNQKVSGLYSTVLLIIILGYISNNLLIAGNVVGVLGYIFILIVLLISINNARITYNKSTSISVI